jgi:hypothetical protein
VLPASCSHGLPSEVPLGGTETARDSDAPSHAGSRAPSATRSEGGAPSEDEDEDEKKADKGDSKDAGDGAADETIEVSAAPSASASNDKKAAAPPAATASAGKAPCDDSKGSAPSCDPLQSGACGDVFGPLCEQLGEALKPKIATAVVDCLVENNRRSRCESIQECLEQGLELACVSPEDSEVCEKLFNRCGPPEEGPWQEVDQCARGLASLKKAARAKVVECLEDSCDLEGCFLGVGG